MFYASEKKYDFVIDTTAVQTRLKQEIAKGVKNEMQKAKIYKRLKAIIRAFCIKIVADGLRREYEVVLAESCVRWYERFAKSFALTKSMLSAFKSGAQATKKNLPPAGPSVDISTPGNENGGFYGIGFNIPNRPYLSDNKYGVALVEDYQQKFRSELSRAIKDLAYDEAKTVKSGSLRNIAECRVRWETNMSDVAAMKASGVRLVWITSHADCSKRCEPWQGRLYSTDGTYGFEDGIAFEPLENAMLGEKHDGNGIISGYNCRHRLLPYKKYSVPPNEYSQAEIAKERKVDQRQRSMETAIRKKKQEAFIAQAVDGIKSKDAKKLFAEAREMEERYRKFSKDNGRAAYIWRTRVTRDEKTYTIEQAKNSRIDKKK